MNLSDSGVLFASAGLEAGVMVELVLSPPIRVGWIASQPTCAAEVVRVDGRAVAVRFAECRFSV